MYACFVLYWGNALAPSWLLQLQVCRGPVFGQWAISLCVKCGTGLACDVAREFFFWGGRGSGHSIHPIIVWDMDREFYGRFFARKRIVLT